MKTATRDQSGKVIGYKIILGLLITAAALSNATQDLNQLQHLADNGRHLGAQLLNLGITKVNAKSISGNGSCKNVNGADQLGRNILVRSTPIEADGDLSVNLPSTVSTDFKADVFNRTTSSDFPGSVSRFVRVRRFRGAFGSDRRELVLKTGSISLRPVG
jgi:hypothetical protein